MINIIKCNNFVLLTNINVTFINYQEFKSETMNLRRKSKAEAEKRSILRILSFLKTFEQVFVHFSELTPIHTRPTGFSSVPPPGPAMPVVATE